MDKNPDIKCDICGETDFSTKEGFYYCNECGTQSQAIRDIEFDDGEFDQVRYSAKKIKPRKQEKQKLTSWECFNYLLRGLVDELIGLGAKEELKITALQLWTCYLKKMEVAFFSTKKVELPKLGVRFDIKDANILYNQSIRAKRQRSVTSGSSGSKNWKRQKREFDKSQYETLSSSQAEISHTSIYTSISPKSSDTTSTINHGIRLKLSRNARKYYKTIMKSKHLDKHEKDSKLEMNCHKLQAGTKILKNKDQYSCILNRRLIYSILYLALNLIEDDIQLSDLLRFMREGHLSTTKFTHFFPEDIADECEKTLNSKLYFSSDKYYNRTIRLTGNLLCRFIHIPNLKLPNLLKLSKRYIRDLCLPDEISIYIKRLLILCPPQMKAKFQYRFIPCYEGRAMAYIIFILKLLFGLDDCRENQISESIRLINIKLNSINSSATKLFIWNDWVKYIEMRKILITQCHLPTSLYLKENINHEQYIQQLKQQYTEDDVNLKVRNPNLMNMINIFNDVQKKLEKESKPEELLKFPSSLTPYKSYFEIILNDYRLKDKIKIPDFMRKYNSNLDINSYLNVRKLRKEFHENSIHLDVKQISCDNDKIYVRTFRNFNLLRNAREATGIRLRQINNDIDEDEWLNEIKMKRENIVTIQDLTKCNGNMSKKKLKKEKQNNSKEQMNILTNKSNHIDTNKNPNVPDDIQSIHSFDIFNELNMTPLKTSALNEPRKNLENDNILADISDNEYDVEIENSIQDKIEMKITNFDYWILLGKPSLLKIEQIQELESKFPSSFLWLLKTCAKMINIKTIDLYQELLIIENYFINVLEPLNNFENILKFKPDSEDLLKYNNIKSLKSLF